MATVLDVTPAGKSAHMPARIFIALGIFFLAYQSIGYVRWLLGPGFIPGPTGPDPIPHQVLASVQSGQLGQTLCAGIWTLALAGFWLQRRRLTWPILLTCAWTSVYWQDPLVNALSHNFSYNAYFVNRGDWSPYLPGMPLSANTLTQPFLLEGMVFYWQIPVWALLTELVMRGARRWLGVRSGVALVLLGWAVLFAADYLLETRGIKTQMLAWNRVNASLSLHAGTPMQWPLYEGVSVSLVWAAGGFLHYFRGKNRFTAFDLPDGSGLTTLLMASGFFNLIFLAYNLVLVFFSGSSTAAFPSWLSAP